MRFTEQQNTDRRAYLRQLVAQGVEPREATRIATERVTKDWNALMLRALVEEPEQPPDYYESPAQAAERIKKAEAEEQAADSGGLKPLTPDHPVSTRVIPHEFARCGLFGVADPNAKRAPSGNPVFKVYGGGTISYKGPQLRQDDRQVFFEALYAERSTPGVAIIKPNSFLVDMGWSRNTAARQKLRACLERLLEARVTIDVPRLGKTVMTHLFTTVEAMNDGSYRVKFDETVRSLYDGNHYTQLVREYEQKLERRSDLAKWLMLFYSTHREPIPMLLSTLKELCGDHASDKYDFKDKVAAAIKQLVRTGFLTEGGITRKVAGKSGTEKVVVKRRHLPKFRK